MENPQNVMSELMNFMKNRIVLTASELDIFTKLESPLTIGEMAEKEQFDIKGLTRLLDSLVAVGYLQKQKDRYHNTEKGMLFSSHHPETVLPIALHFNRLWDSWSSLTDIVKGRKSGHGATLRVDKKSTEAFVGAMHVIGRSLSEDIVEFYNAERFECLLDIGGASGTYTIAFLERYPKLKAVLFDLKEVIPIARKRLKSYGYDKRLRFVSGDFYTDDLPEGCDLALLSAIIHQNSPEENILLYKKIYKAIKPGGALLIRDHIMDETRTNPVSGAIFAINMLVNTTGGGTYTFPEVKKTLKQVGFSDIKIVRKGDRMDCLVEATKR